MPAAFSKVRYYHNVTHPVKVVFLVDLLFDLLINVHFDDVRIAFPRGGGGLMIHKAQSFLVCLDNSLGLLLLFVDGVLEITRETLDLLYLLLQIAAKARKLHDHLVFEIFSLVGLAESLLMEVA
jgi:hypothetical protein